MSALALALLLPSTVAMQWGTSVATDTTGGIVSVAPGVEARPTVSTSITPGASFGLDSGTKTLTLRYGLRLFRRFELGAPPAGGQQIAEIDRFLLNHTAGLGAGLRLAKGWGINANVSMSIGEVDVPSAQSVLGQAQQQQQPNNTRAGQAGIPTPAGQPGTATAPTDPNNAPGSFLTADGTLSTAMINGGVSLDGQLAKGLTFNMAFQGSYSGPLSTTSTSSGFAQAQQASLGTTLSIGRALTRNDALNGTVAAAFSFAPLIGDYRSISVLVGYTRRLGRYTTASASVGILSIARIKAPDTTTTVVLPPPPDSLSPAFTLRFDTQVLNLRDVRSRLNLQSAISPQQNFATGAFEPRLNTTAGLSFNFGTKWSTGVMAMLGTVAAFEAVDTTMQMGMAGQAGQQFQFSETMFSLQVPLAYAVSQGFSLGANFSMSTVGERLANGLTNAFRFPSYQGSVTASFSINQNL